MTRLKDRYGFLQGKAFAVELLQSAKATLELPGGIQAIIDNLERALINKPPAHAEGIQAVISELKGAL